MLQELHKPNEINCATEQTLTFIKENAQLEPTKAALKAPRNAGIDIPFAVDQIKGLQIAQQKLPKWALCDEIIYPAHISMEQCSSQATAQYKADFAQELLKNLNVKSPTLVDLTGGFGVDCIIMSKYFDSAILVEQQSELSSIAQHNIKAFGINNIQCYNDNCLDALNSIPCATIIYVDPARRNTQGARTYAIEDCTPNVLELKNQLLNKAQLVMIKLSPMLDWHKVVDDFQGNVSSVHIVAHRNECKELLIVLDNKIHANIQIYCVNDNQKTVIQTAYSNPKQLSAQNMQNKQNVQNVVDDSAKNCNKLSIKNWKDWAQYVYEPNAAIMKAGCFSKLEDQYKMHQLNINSHVYVSEKYCADFPGKIWKIDSVCSMNKREIKQALANITHANIVTRNFPISVESLRKRLRLKDGGNTRIIATTDSNSEHVLIFASEVNAQK